MPNVKVLTDSLADIPPKAVKELDVTTVPAVVRFGETQYRDRVDLFSTEFFRLLVNSPKLPSTSQPSYGVFQDTYRRLADETEQNLAIHTDGLLSGIYNASSAAAANMSGVRIRVVDSRQVSMALGWLVILAARAAKQGSSLDEVERLVQAALLRVHLVAMLDTLEYARRGGRLGKAQAL